MIRVSLALATVAVLLATPAAAQHAGHGAPAAPAAPAKPTTPAAPAAQGHDAHGGHAGHGAAAGHSAEHMSGWKELDAYHMVMMQAWHPAKENRNLAPARAQASTLAARAEAWAASSIPAVCDTPAARASVRTVHEGSRAFAQLVQRNAEDADVLAALRSLHEEFEKVNRGCKVR